MASAGLKDGSRVSDSASDSQPRKACPWAPWVDGGKPRTEEWRHVPVGKGGAHRGGLGLTMQDFGPGWGLDLSRLPRNRSLHI